MVVVKHITSRSEIPEGEPYVLVMFGEKQSEADEARGHVFTVPHGSSMAMSDLSFTAAVHAAKEVAKHEKLSVVYACK